MFMDKPRRPYRVSLFAKFTLVILLLGIVPIVLLVTVMQNRMLTEYRASLEDAYQDAIAYSAYSIRVRLDNYTDLSKFCYYYNNSSQGDFAYDYNNYDNLRKILTGETFADTADKNTNIRHEMELFLHYLNMTDANIEASHFIYVPAESGSPVSYHLGNYNNSLFDSSVYLNAVDYANWDTESRKMILVPTHALNYVRFHGSRTQNVFTVGRNYYDLNGAVGHEKYVGTLFLDLRTNAFDNLFATLNLTDGGTVYVTDTAGHCYFSSDPALVGQTLDLTDADAGTMLLSESIPQYGLTVWCSQSRTPIEKQIQAMQRAMWLVVALAMATLVIGSMFFSRKLTQPLRTIMQYMGAVEAGDFTGRIPVTSNDELGDLTERFNQMSAELDNYTKQVYLSKIKQTEAELNALKSQIYPHFLYNTLEVIRMTAVGRNDQMVADMIEALSDQIRYVIGTVNDLVPLGREVDILTKYIYLLNCRFSNKVTFSYDCAHLQNCLIPKLILQPLVENAFIHGVKPMDGPGHIQLMAERLDNTITLTVMDNGVGMDEDALNKLYALLDSDQPGHKENYEWASIGLKNVHDRLRYLYGSDYGITLYSTPGVGTVVKVTIPGDLQNLETEAEPHAENADRG